MVNGGAKPGTKIPETWVPRDPSFTHLPGPLAITGKITKEERKKQTNLQLLPGAADLDYHLVCASRFLEEAEGISPDDFLEYQGNSRDLVCG